MGDGFEGLRQGHTTHGCAIIEQRGEVEPNPLWHRVLSFVMVGREFYSISPLLRNACEDVHRSLHTERIFEVLKGWDAMTDDPKACQWDRLVVYSTIDQ